MESRNSPTFLVEMQNDTAALEDSLAVSYKTKYTLTIQFNVVFLGIYAKELKTCPHKNLDTDIYSSFTLNCKNMDTTNMSFSR